LILSGLTLDQEQAVRAAYRNRDLIPTNPIRLGNWSTLVFHKTSPHKASPRKVADFSGRGLCHKKANRPQRFRYGRFVGQTAGGGSA
jgi:hypothetical protein